MKKTCNTTQGQKRGESSSFPTDTPFVIETHFQWLRFLWYWYADIFFVSLHNLLEQNTSCKVCRDTHARPLCLERLLYSTLDNVVFLPCILRKPLIQTNRQKMYMTSALFSNDFVLILISSRPDILTRSQKCDWAVAEIMLASPIRALPFFAASRWMSLASPEVINKGFSTTWRYLRPSIWLSRMIGTRLTEHRVLLQKSE